MKRRILKLTAVMLSLLMGIGLWALAEGSVRTTVVMRVSHMTQNAVVDAGEDLSIDVSIDGVAPDSYQWYFQGQPIVDAEQKVLNIIDAQTKDAGLYRLDAFDRDGAMLVSMDIAVRVVDRAVPQSGDDSMPVAYAFVGMLLCAGGMAVLLRRRALL